MPSRNTARHDVADSYYHVYARGANKAPIFISSEDKFYFLYLFSRYLSKNQAISKTGTVYPHYRQKIELLTYCLMDNHFHLLIYQNERGMLSMFMKSLMTSYTAYFNQKYRRTGSLFESRFKASLITGDAYFVHVSRYIHLNPRSWKHFPYSSIKYFRNATEPEWLQTSRVLGQFTGRDEYLTFVSDYEDSKQMLDSIKRELANL
ncbi:MAG: transposase [bacterium]|nr:transposase [bacterium]